MSRSIVLASGAAGSFTLAALISSCEPRELPDPGFRPPPVEAIEIEVDCSSDPIRFVVRPWAAWVPEGRPLHWTQEGPGLVSTQIIPKDPDTWPFDRLPPDRPSQAGAPIETGTRQPAPQGVYRYSILLDCGERGTFDIDPDIIVNGDW